MKRALLIVTALLMLLIPASAQAKPRVFAYYYLWWSQQHWHDKLGPNYPYVASPLPLPATLDATGCNPVSRYAGNTLTDVPLQLYSQDDPGFIEADVREAASAGLAGFAVNWIGTGAPNQTPQSNSYNSRLLATVQAVHKVNAEGIPFKLWLSYKASATMLPISAIKADLTYFLNAYGNDTAFDRAQSTRPTVIWNGSRKYSLANLTDISNAYRSRLRILGDETTWDAARAPYLDGDAYYWSSQNPYSNPQSFNQVKALASAVKATGDVWIAPMNPGYNKQLEGGTSCTPRKGGQTLRAIYNGNAPSLPQAWALISWNEITEGTYVDPMTRYGRQELDVLKAIIG